MVGIFSAVFPPAPSFTDASLPDLSSRVFIVTGAASGVGYELSKMLYSKNGTVYVAARSDMRAKEAINKIKTELPGKRGALKPMVVDLADLETIKPAVEGFLKSETRLDVLVHNAGVMEPPAGSKSKLGHDLEMSTHCLGPMLLTKLLENIMISTASTISIPYSVRVVWVTSLLQLSAPPEVMVFDDVGTPRVLPNTMSNYMQSKIGVAWLAAKFAKTLGQKEILSVSVHPGLMRTELQRTMPLPARALMRLLFKPATYGAYSELFGGFSPSLKSSDNGGYILAWGRVAPLPKDIARGLDSEADGGTGKARIFWDFCERETKLYM